MYNSKLYWTLILTSTVTACISISAFTFLLDIPVGIMSSAIGLTICAIAAGIKKWKSIINRKRKKHGKIVLLAKSKINSREVLIYKALIYLIISHNEFALMNVLKEYDNMKEEIKHFRTLTIKDFSLFIKQCCHIV